MKLSMSDQVSLRSAYVSTSFIRRADNLPFVCNQPHRSNVSIVGYHPPLKFPRKAFDTVSNPDSRLNGSILIRFFNSAAF